MDASRLEIPELPPDLHDSVSSLLNSATTMHMAFTSLLAAVLEGDAPRTQAENLLHREHSHTLMLAEGVIKRWETHLGHDVDDHSTEA